MSRWFFALVPLAFGCHALGLVCTEMGCIGSLTIVLSRPLADDAVVSIDLGPDGVFDCTPSGDTFTGCSLTEEGGEPAIVVQPGAGEPETVVVEIGEGGAEPAAYDVEVTWGDRWYPNGKACDGPDGGCVSGEGFLQL